MEKHSFKNISAQPIMTRLDALSLQFADQIPRAVHPQPLTSGAVGLTPTRSAQLISRTVDLGMMPTAAKRM